MGTVALVLVALVVGWLGALLLVRDVARLEFKDFAIAATGALTGALVMVRLGVEVWGESGLRMPVLMAMAGSAVLTLISSNLLRGRGLRAGISAARI